MPRSKLFESLNILSENVEINGALNASEFELLKQVRREMVAFESELTEADTDWTDCPVGTTILYNLAVSSSENDKLSIARRGYSTIAKNMVAVDVVLKSSKKGASHTQLFSFSKPRVVDREHTAHERAIQEDLFKALKASRQLTSRRRLFVRLYWLAACKSASIMFTRWDTLGTAARREKAKGAKLETMPVTGDQEAELSVQGVDLTGESLDPPSHEHDEAVSPSPSISALIAVSTLS